MESSQSQNENPPRKMSKKQKAKSNNKSNTHNANSNKNNRAIFNSTFNYSTTKNNNDTNNQKEKKTIFSARLPLSAQASENCVWMLVVGKIIRYADIQFIIVLSMD